MESGQVTQNEESDKKVKKLTEDRGGFIRTQQHDSGNGNITHVIPFQTSFPFQTVKNQT